MYDNDNVFAKIARGEIPCEKIAENDYALSFHDVNPMFAIHALVIPKGPYMNILDFTANASAAEQAGFWRCFTQTAEKLGIAGNFNVLANAGAAAPFVPQSVFHFHLHLMSGARRPEFDKEMAAICHR
ncbi:MAG: HIT domain-containing protein [Alphaproteobacteria bacterium]|nr:HIT domain-containing protein [Alphaproteobacteria bacterium]